MPTDRTPLRTLWADDLDPARPLPEYPRPQLRRDRWQNLNGAWEFALAWRDEPCPDHFGETIVVPFPIESALSGIERPVTPEQRAWYRRRFDAPPLAAGERLLLHFGAVDWECALQLNGRDVGSHRGGHVPFHFDVTDLLVADAPQELVVAVWDPTDRGPQPVGKQSLEPKGIQYPAVTGIWQTVWLEPVAATRVASVRVEASLREARVDVRVALVAARPGDLVEATIAQQRVTAPAAADRTVLSFAIPDLRAWSPDDPFLYDLEIVVRRAGNGVDRVDSYFGAREVCTGRDRDGIWRLLLNGQPIFHLGVLDQGWWPDGLYTAATDEALAFDIAATKRMGFNTIRKHVKVEPARWYWHADRQGLLVWQDMPSPRFDQAAFIKRIRDERIRPQEMDYELEVTPEAAVAFRDELDGVLDALEPFTCIVTWVPFNEAWGQFDTDAILSHVASRDPSRVVDGASGWQDTGSGAIRDHHLYNEEKTLPPLEDDRPIVYGEFGGLKLLVDGHRAFANGWGYQQLETAEAFADAYAELLGVIEGLVERGLAGAIYTQTTDVESEMNGLLSYDRTVFKIAPEALTAIHRRVLARLSPLAGHGQARHQELE